MFLDIVYLELRPIEHTNGTHYLQTEAGFNTDEATRAYDAWVSTRDLDGCAEDRVDVFLTWELEAVKDRGIDYFFALVDGAGNVAPEETDALKAAEARGAEVIKLTAAEMAYYWPGRVASFSFADITAAEMAFCSTRVGLDAKLRTTTRTTGREPRTTLSTRD